MAIEQQTKFIGKCDGCGYRCYSNQSIYHESEEAVVKVLRRNDWVKVGGNWYCLPCQESGNFSKDDKVKKEKIVAMRKIATQLKAKGQIPEYQRYMLEVYKLEERNQ